MGVHKCDTTVNYGVGTPDARDAEMICEQRVVAEVRQAGIG
jgi:hypothetical protein